MSGHDEHRRKHNEEFLRRLIARRPDLAAKYAPLLDAARRVEEAAPGTALESLEFGAPEEPPVSIALETIVNDERPVLFVVNDRLDTKQVTIKGLEAQDLVDRMKEAEAWLAEFMPLIGRVDVSNFPGEYVGTGWFVEETIVVTNRHVASLIARHDGRKFVFKLGVGNRGITASVNTTHELDDNAFDPSRDFKVEEVLYIEPDSGPHDIAFLRVSRRATGVTPKFIPVAGADIGPEQLVCAIGYPARASKKVIPDQQLMQDLYLGRFDIKRAAPGFTMATKEGTSRHDCTTLGGNSGSVVLDLKTKQAVGLHFAGLYQETNFAVRASVLSDYITRKRWTLPLVVTAPKPKPKPEAPGVPQSTPQSTPAKTTTVTTTSGGAGTVNITVPLEISFRLGAPIIGPITATISQGQPGDASQPRTAARAEAVAVDCWKNRPSGVTGVRVGFLEEDDDTIGDVPFIAVSAPASQLAAIEAAGPNQLDGFVVRYEAADALEQLEASPDLEVSTSIMYDDDARTGEEFSFDPVTESMDLLLHVGPEYSWDVLKQFLDEASGHIVSAMYEFHAVSVKDALQSRLDDDRNTSLTLVLDNATLHSGKDPKLEIKPEELFTEWSDRYGDRFQHVIVPEGKSGLISDSYHIKVTVRDDDTFWLSSGNWKMKSSQPLITENDRLNSGEKDLPGNREWHVVVRNKTLADRFRAHILQDLQHSKTLLGQESVGPAATDIMVDVPIEETIMLERKPPSRLVEPMVLTKRRAKVQMLLTPDSEGAMYSDPVLSLIKSAKKSLLFQIPYMKTPSSPKENRGYIDELINALIDKLVALPDARVILSKSGSGLSSPTNVAWHFKSKGVDITERLRSIDKHHTKGMIVDGKRVLIGSHNWSASGVTLNRDASLIIHDADVAGYYAQAFEVDWERANPVTPKKFVKPPKNVEEAVGGEAPQGYVRMSLKEALSDE
ncbi:MAG TPA: phospholipase D-like domain-containing protein [Thermoanaerobaculia bacterium]|nr:phospholipase D-like domain-containing protein [Thermoanaerobaculia bacterium]